MSNNFDKIVKLACKPKNAPPKAKYVDVLVSATYADDGSLNDIIRSLSLRLREPNAVVVFKGLLTLHQMIRSGSTDQLLEFLSQGDTLRLRNVSGQNWEGYAPPSNMGAYASYLDSRIRAWRDLRHDLVRVQAESNRRSDGLGAGSKARRLRHLPVEKGLLREVKQVQRVLDSLIQCRFYDDDLRDENTVLAFRMLIKDLLVLFQAGNEGVCNILEHYFEMSKSDATESFEIYKSFIKQTDRVVDYLGVARKLHNVVNVPVPNLKHAPTGLVKALEEYLNDPNFEANRREYKASLGVVEGKPVNRSPSPNPPVKKEEPKSSTSASSSAAPAAASASSAPSAPPGAPQKIQDFFDSIQADQQPTIFGGPAQPFPQQAQGSLSGPFNPFRQSMMLPQQTGFMQPQMTGFGMPQQQQPMPFLQPQMTGAMAFGSLSNRQSMFPQQAPNQFGQQEFIQAQQTGFQPPQTGFQPQHTGFIQQPQPLQPQSTGSNPFRQSMMLNTSNINPSGALSQPTSPFGGQHQIQRPGSTPAFSSPPIAKPLTAQATGSKNPFASPPGATPPVPKGSDNKGPSMNELAWGKQQQQFGGLGGFGGGSNLASQPTGSNSPWSTVDGKAAQNGGTGVSDVASSFTFDGSKTASSPSSNSNTNDFLSQFGSLSVGQNNTGSTSQFGSLSSNPTGPISPSKTGFLQPQPTGYGGSTVKRFQPTSSFGSQLLENLPPIAEPSPSAASPSANVQPQSTGFPFSSGGQAPGQGAPGGGFNQGLSPQQTGLPNPFRQSTFGGAGIGQPQQTGGQPQPFGQAFGQPQGQNVGGGAFGVGSPFAGQNQQRPNGGQQQQQPNHPFGGMNQFGMFGQQQQQNAGGSLI